MVIFLLQILMQYLTFIWLGERTNNHFTVLWSRITPVSRCSHKGETYWNNHWILWSLLPDVLPAAHWLGESTMPSLLAACYFYDFIARRYAKRRKRYSGYVRPSVRCTRRNGLTQSPSFESPYRGWVWKIQDFRIDSKVHCEGAHSLLLSRFQPASAGEG